MKQFIKYAAVAVGGYLVGFYEYKYKMLKIIAEVKVDKLKTEVKKQEEESQK